MAKRKNQALSLDTPEDWQAENDLRTMMECKKIEADPKRLAKVRTLAKQKMLDAASVATDDAGAKV